MRALLAWFSASLGMAVDSGGVTPRGFAPGVAMVMVKLELSGCIAYSFEGCQLVGAPKDEVG